MEPTIKLDRTMVAVDVDGVVHVLVELQAPPAPGGVRQPIDVVLVLDRSGSMDGAPLEAVKEATCGLLRLLGPHDRLGVVAFDDAVQMVLPLVAHDQHAAAHRIRQIGSGGSTNLSGGWLKGCEMLTASPRSDALRRIVVLTDGHANCGVTDPQRLCGLTSAASALGISTSMIGFDDGYDEVLLAAMADAGAGNDYWCAGADQAAAVFAAEFEGLASVVAQNISVEITAQPDCELMVLNEYPITTVPSGLQVALGDAYGGECRRVVAALTLPAEHTLGPKHVADVTIRWASTIGVVALHTTVLPVTVDVGAEGDEVVVDAETVEYVNVLRAASARKRAHRHLQEGDTGAARAEMAATLDLLRIAAAPAAEIAEAERDLTDLDQGDWSAASSKRMYSSMRSTAKGRRSRFDDET